MVLLAVQTCPVSNELERYGIYLLFNNELESWDTVGVSKSSQCGGNSDLFTSSSHGVFPLSM